MPNGNSEVIRRYTTTTSRVCQYCGNEFNAKGFAKHEKACKTRHENAKRDREFEDQLTIEAIASRRAKRARILEKSIHNFPGTENHNGVNIPSPPPNDYMDDVSEGNDYGPSAAEDHVFGMEDTEDLSDLQTCEQYGLDDIKVEYHPGSGRGTKVYPFDDFHRINGIFSPPTDNEPWRPFRCRTDYDFARIALEAALKPEQINGLIKIIKSVAEGTSKFTVSSSKDLMDTWKAASLKLTPFEKKDIKVSFKKEEKKYEVWYRPLRDYAVELLEDARLMPYFTWDAERLYKFNGTRFVRFIDEPWTADAFWDIQSNLPAGAHPLCFILYADKNKLSSFGTEKGYPVIARCANIHVKVRNGTGIGGGRIVGWLPVVEEEAATTKSLLFTNHKREVWHTAMFEIIKSIVMLSKTGFTIICGDGVKRQVYPCIPILSADYEEQAFMTLIRGATADFPCPVCLVAHKKLSDLTCESSLRTGIDSEETIKECFGLTKAEAEKTLKKKGLRLVNNVFWKLNNSDPHKAVSWDRLHGYSSGVFGGHFWKEFKSVISCVGRKAEAQLDHKISFSVFPRFRNLHHFDSVLKICFNDGSKFEDLAKQLLYAAHNVISSKDSTSGYFLLRCLRSFLELDTYFSFEVHTEETIAAGEEELANFSKLISSYKTLSLAEFEESKNWDFIKMHLQKHAFTDIKAKGATKNYNTKPNEKLHGPLRDSYQLRTNYKDVAKQILRADHYLLVSALISSRISELEQHNEEHPKSDDEISRIEPETVNADVSGSTPAETEEISPNENNDFDYKHFSLGSTLRKRVTMRSVELLYAGDSAFNNFRKKLSEHLNTSFAAHNIPLPGGKRIQVGADDLLTVHRYLKVNYESLVTWRQMTDHLRCNPKFFGHPRYDSIIFQTVNKEIFGRLIYMFTVLINAQEYPIALVQPCDAPFGPARQRDLDFRLTRVKARPRTASEFVSIHSIRRGAVLVPDSEKYDEYLVMDVLDADMFLRVKNLNSELST